MVSKLERIKYCNIEVELFTTKIEGIEFGLTKNEEDKSINLQPSSTLAFYEPWDGEYYT